jgi:hypothetical protein
MGKKDPAVTLVPTLGCKRVRSSTLRKLQAEIRKRFALPPEVYRMLHAKTPIC